MSPLGSVLSVKSYYSKSLNFYRVKHISLFGHLVNFFLAQEERAKMLGNFTKIIVMVALSSAPGCRSRVGGSSDLKQNENKRENLLTEEFSPPDKKRFEKIVGKFDSNRFKQIYISSMQAMTVEPLLTQRRKIKNLDGFSYDLLYSHKFQEKLDKPGGIQTVQLIQASRIPHIWVKSDANGILEIGSSFILPNNKEINPELISQEIFYFSGENIGKARFTRYSE